MSDELAELRDEIRALREQVDQQARELTALRAGPAPAPATDREGDDDVRDGDAAMARRHLLRNGGLAAGAALLGGTAATVLTASPAAAVPPVQGISATDYGVYGSSSANGFAGTIGETASLGVVGLRGRHTNGGVGIEGISSGNTNGTAILGTASVGGGTGVKGEGASVGVYGNALAAGGVGVRASSTGGPAVNASSTTGAAISAYSTQGDGMQVTSDGPTKIAIDATATGATATALKATGHKGLQVNGDAYGAVVNAFTGIGIEIAASKAQLFLFANGSAPPTRSDQHYTGEIVEDGNNDLWVCVAAGQPGTWRRLAGPDTAGSLVVLPAPVRIYDSRPGPPSSSTPKGIFVNETRSVDATPVGSPLPAGVTAVMVNFAVTTTNSGGYGTLWATGQPWPGTANINWGLPNLTLSNSVVTAVDATGSFECKIAGTANVVLDLIGYYR